MTIWTINIKIFIAHIKSAIEANLTVNNHNLSVVTIIHKYIENRYKRIEGSYLNSFREQSLYKAVINIGKASEVIIYDSYFNAFLDLPCQNIFYFFEGNCILHRKIFHKYIFFSLRQLFKHRLISLICL